jgi:hypothetical protein
MLNRTNRTLSANGLGLNLGTRSLVLSKNDNAGDTTLRAHLSHVGAMRAGVPASYEPAIHPSPIAITGIPGSFSVVGWPTVVPPVRRPAFTTDSQCDSRPRVQQELAEPKRKPMKGMRLGKMLASAGARLRARGARAAAAGAYASAAGG